MSPVPEMTVGTLADRLDGCLRGRADAPVGGVSHDSRMVRSGDVFVAMKGANADGHDFVAEALARGAAAVICERPFESPTPQIVVGNGRVALARAAAEVYGHPSRFLRLVGVTGTNGKTTVVHMIESVARAAGESTGVIGTLGARIGDRVLATPLTTPEASDLHRQLAMMRSRGVETAVIEVSSHGLALHRVDCVRFDLAVFTNLGHDHLDFHGSTEAYHAAKARLFESLPADGPPVLNADEPEAAAYLAARTRARVLRYAVEGGPGAREAPVRAEAVEWGRAGSRFRLALQGPGPGAAALDARAPLPGHANLQNALAALAVAHALGLDPARAAAGVAASPGVPGRMERVADSPVEVVVDYAHTEAALRQLLATLRTQAAGRLIAVFGCAGERGVERRAGMWRAAAELADYSVLTEEDPRSEEPAAILEAIASAMRGAGGVEGATFERVPDRREAIARALDLARPGDVVVLSGKGHERSIERSDGEHPWDERGVAGELVRERFGSGARRPAGDGRAGRGMQ